MANDVSGILLVMLKSSSSGESIKIQKLTKQYPGTKTPALKDLTLHVNSGEVYGFLGSNGAGKSTTIRTLLNFLQPTGGSAKIKGLDIVADSVEIKKHVGYLSGDFAIYPKMTGKQYLQYMSELQPPASKKYMNELITRFEAQPSKKMGDLSRGNRQKFGIIQAFMHQPDILFLDEPSSGLDPLMQEEFYKLVNESKERGAAIFLSSHVMAEVQRTCDRVGVIRGGKLVDEMVIAELREKAARVFVIQFENKAPLAELRKIPKSKVENRADGSVVVHMHSELKALFKVLAKHDVKSLDAENLDLENMFLGFYSGGKK